MALRGRGGRSAKIIWYFIVLNGTPMEYRKRTFSTVKSSTFLANQPPYPRSTLSLCVYVTLCGWSGIGRAMDGTSRHRRANCTGVNGTSRPRRPVFQKKTVLHSTEGPFVVLHNHGVPQTDLQYRGCTLTCGPVVHFRVVRQWQCQARLNRF